MKTMDRYRIIPCVIWFMMTGFVWILVGCVSTNTPTNVAQTPSTPTPEVFIPRTMVVPTSPMIFGHVLHGTTPVVGARIELHTGIDSHSSAAIAQTISNSEGYYELEAPPNGGRFILVAIWPDGALNSAPHTPVDVAAQNGRVLADIFLSKSTATNLDVCSKQGYNTYLDRTKGYCLVYPPNFVSQVNELGNLAVYGPALDNHAEALRASLLVETIVTKNDKTLSEIVDDYMVQFEGLDVPPISRSFIKLAGRPAELLEIVPGREGSRDVFMLNEGTLFHLIFQPSVRDFPQAKDDAELLYNTVVNAFNLISLEAGTAGQLPEAYQIIPLNEKWYQYINHQFGYSLNYPQTIVVPYGTCRWSENNGDHSYRLEPLYVPVSILVDGATTYIASEYYHELGGEIRETDVEGVTRTFYSECQAVTNSLELLRNQDQHYQNKWEIIAGEVYDDSELDAFIKSRYGAGCSLGEKVLSNQNGVYDVRIQGDGKDLSETQCPLNKLIVLKYYPEAHRAVTWDLGQAPTFVANLSYAMAYDQTMIDSFRFLTEMPPVPGNQAYNRVEIGTTDLSVAIPSGWLRLEPEWVWTPSPESKMRLGINWVDLQPAQEVEAVILPQPASIIDTKEIALSWGSGRILTIEVYAPAEGSDQAPVASVEAHTIVIIEQNGVRRAFDLYTVAPTQDKLAASMFLFQYMLDTSALK